MVSKHAEVAEGEVFLTAPIWPIAQRQVEAIPVVPLGPRTRISEQLPSPSRKPVKGLADCLDTWPKTENKPARLRCPDNGPFAPKPRVWVRSCLAQPEPPGMRKPAEAKRGTWGQFSNSYVPCGRIFERADANYIAQSASPVLLRSLMFDTNRVEPPPAHGLLRSSFLQKAVAWIGCVRIIPAVPLPPRLDPEVPCASIPPIQCRLPLRLSPFELWNTRQAEPPTTSGIPNYSLYARSAPEFNSLAGWKRTNRSALQGAVPLWTKLCNSYRRRFPPTARFDGQGCLTFPQTLVAPVTELDRSADLAVMER